MKKVSLVIMVLAVVSMISCKSMKNMDYVNLAGQLKDNVNTSGSDSVVASAVSGGVEFKSGEVLCANEDREMIESDYSVAKILTPASAATKNQAKVLFVDGRTKWTNFVIPSRKATKADMVVGKFIFVGRISHWESVNQDQYRKTEWELKRITSTDELFKNVVEADGDKVYIKWIRVPNTPISE